MLGNFNLLKVNVWKIKNKTESIWFKTNVYVISGIYQKKCRKCDSLFKYEKMSIIIIRKCKVSMSKVHWNRFSNNPKSITENYFFLNIDIL